MIEKWALAIQRHEGFFAGSRSQRNNNPGNLRFTTYTASLGKNRGKDSGNFIIYDTYEIGFKALKQFLIDAATDVLRPYRAKAKEVKKDSAGKLSLYEFYSAYAPTSDGNAPRNYAEAVAADLGVSPETRIKDLLDPVAIPVPTPVTPTTVKPGQVISQKQGDPRWGSFPIGNSNTNLAADGCLITDISDYLYWLGVILTPKDLAKLLDYTPAGKLYWASLKKAGIEFVYRYWNFDKATQIQAEAALAHPTKGVMLEVKMKSGSIHWVWALSTKLPKYRMADPLPGDFGNTLLRYGGRVIGCAIVDKLK
jgi:hypothetical protein